MFDTALKVLKKITNYGYQAYIIGGYPRDLYLKIGSKDIDICTDATPKEIMNIFPKIATSNFEYGSVIITYENINFEITTFRKEGKYKDYRKPSSIRYIDSLEEDLKRRDFTINTMCIDKNGQTIDLLNAKQDLNNQIIRMIGNPKIRLKEDALRIMRAVRFATVLNFQLEPVLKVYIKKYGYLLKKISKDRQKEELDLIFSSPNKEYGIKLLCELKLADHLEISNLKKIKITPSLLVTWAQLNVLDKFNFNTSEREIIIGLQHLKNINLLDSKVLYEYGLYLCTLACELNEINKKQLNEVYLSMPIHSKEDIAITPTEICEILNKKPGGFLKTIINDLEEKLLTNQITNNKKDLAKYILKKYNENIDK